MCFPRRLFSLLSVNKTCECLLLDAWQEHYICVFACVCLCVHMFKKKTRKYSEADNKKINEWQLSMRLCPGAGRPEAVSHAEDHRDFAPASPVLRRPQFCQWTPRFKAAPHSDLVLSAKLQPGIILKLQTFLQTLLQS